MKKIKILLLSLVALVSMFSKTMLADAASLSISGSSTTSSTVVGNSFTVTFKFSSGNPLGAVVYSMSYDSSLLTLTGGSTQSNALSYTGSQKSDSVSFTFKAKAKGSATVSFKVNEALDFDGNALSAGSASKTITIKTQADVEASYSKNNNLSSLELSAGTLDSAFDKNKTEYSATVENEVDKITVSGNKEDSKSSVEGFKEYELEEGTNRIEIKVTAQNGSAKTYVINITRKELAPINVKTEEGLDLAVVRKKELLKSPNGNYEETTIKIGEEEVPGLFNKSTNTYLVGLKNEEGEIKLYTYKDNKYTLYKEFSFDSIIITATKGNIPEGYKEETIKINDEDVTVYKDIEGKDNYYLLNGVNIATGEEHLYQYDVKEKTIQIVNNDLLTKIDLLNAKNNNYLYVIIGLGSLLIITYIFILISSIRKNEKTIKSLDKKIEESKDKKEEVEKQEEEKEEIKEDINEDIKEEPIKEEPKEEINEEVQEKKKKKRRRNEFDFGDDDVSILDVEPIKEEIVEEEPIVEEEEKKERTAIFEKPLDETQDIEAELDKIEENLHKKAPKRRKRTKEVEK